MQTAYLIVSLITIAMNAAIALADLYGAPFVVANATAVGVSRSWLPLLGAVKSAGALGVGAGLVIWPPIGIAAAGGLVLFYLGAIAAHVRAGVFHNIAAPGAFLGVAGGCLVLALALPGTL
jgi:hypothetical protein